MNILPPQDHNSPLLPRLCRQLPHWFSSVSLQSSNIGGLALIVLIPFLLGVTPASQFTLRFNTIAVDANASFSGKSSLQLHRYAMAGPPVRLTGINDNASGLTINPTNGNLLLVNNNPTQILEYTPSGDLVRTIELEGFHDTEALAHLHDNQFALAEERRGTIMQIAINAETHRISRQQSSLLATIDRVGTNSGIEGLAYDKQTQRLHLVLENKPAKLITIPLAGQLEVAGQLEANNHPVPVTVISDRFMHSAPKVPGQLRDLSGLYFADDLSTLLLLSDESKALVELDHQQQELSRIRLDWLQLGLFNAIPQAEGVTIGNDGTLYICSEPNLLYRFRYQPIPLADPADSLRLVSR